MAKQPAPDPLEFDPTAKAKSQEGRRDRALRLDFSDVEDIEEHQRVSRRAGASRMDPDSFLSRSERAALERAQVAPRRSLPNLIERDQRSAGVRVVHRSRHYRVYLALGIAIPALLVSAATWGLSRWRAAERAREVEELRRSEALHRQLELAREKHIER